MSESENASRHRLCAHHFATHPPRRCGSPALRNEDFCYYHHPTRRPVSNLTRFARQENIARAAHRVMHQSQPATPPRPRIKSLYDRRLHS